MSNFKYISKTPCGEDLFAGKVHERTAEQVVAQLLESKDSLIIGIDGGWGTGKSNLIRMIEKKVLSKNPNALFFTYDAWGHQNDMPRRSILEELTSKITESNILSEKDKKGWQSKLKMLMSQRREISTKSIPKVSTGILVLSLVVVMTPVFSVIGEMIPSEWYRWVQLLITTLPLIFGLLYAICKFYRLENRDWRSFLNEFVSLYQEKTKEETSYEEVFSEEPTSSQFRLWMKELDDHLQAPLILVFDNMDRLPVAKVQELWSAIHAYFAEETYKKIQVIVPFDREHIIAAFKGENCNKDIVYGNDFIDKTFDIVFRVAPPTLSNWKGYLYAQWKEAFSEQLHPEHSITQIYDLLTNGKTPREIVAFINECVTIRKTCTTNIPIEYVALFVVGRQAIDLNPQKELLSLDFLKSLAYKYHTEETSKYLSGLYYQLSPEEALDLVYAEQLRRELEGGEHTMLQHLVSQSIFSEILEHAIAEVTQVANATRAFAIVDTETPIATRFWDQLVLKTSNEKESPTDYQIILLKHSTEGVAKQYLEGIVKSIYVQCQRGETQENLATEIFDAYQFYQAINSLERELADYENLTPSPLLHKEKASPKAFLHFVSAAKKGYENYMIYCPIEEIDTYVSEMSLEELEDMEGIKYLLEVEKKKLSKYETKLKTEIEAVTEVREAEILMMRWVELGIPAEGLLSDSSIHNLFTKADKDSLLYHCLICMRLSRGTSFSYSSMNTILQNEDENLINKLGQYINLFISYGDLLLMYSGMGDYPIYKSLLQHIVSKRLGSRMSIGGVLPYTLHISEVLEIPTEQLLLDWERWKQYFNTGITKEVVKLMPIDFYARTTSLGHLKVVSYIRNVTIEYLRDISVEDWCTYFRKETNEYELLLLLGCDCSNAYEAFKQTIKTELETQEMKLLNDAYQKLLSLFESQKKKWGSVFPKVRDRYGEMGLDVTIDLFKRYGTPLIVNGKLSENPNAIRCIIPTALLTNIDTAKILIDRSDDVTQILNSAGNEYLQEFSDMILSVCSSNSELRENMKVLASALKIKIPSGDDKV